MGREWVSSIDCPQKETNMATETERILQENSAVSSDQTAEISRAVFAVEGMTCASCAMRIEKGLKKVPGVRDANVNLATEQATIMYEPTQTNLEQMVQKVEAVGYKATPQVISTQQSVQETATSVITETYGTPILGISQEDELSRRKQAEIVRKRNLLILGIVLTVPVVILSMF